MEEFINTLEKDEKEDMIHRIKTYQPLTQNQVSYIRIYYQLKMNDQKAPPFTLEEVESFENKIGNKLPPFFRAYILYISRELKVNDDEMFLYVYLNDDIPTKKHNSKFAKLNYFERQRVKHVIETFGIYDEDEKSEINKIVPDVFDGCYCITDIAYIDANDFYFRRYYLVVKGDDIGKVLKEEPCEDFHYCGHIDDIIKTESFEMTYSGGNL